MANPDDDFELVESPLGGEVKRDGTTIMVHIYRGTDEADWVLEVVDPAGASIVWDDRFATDRAAMDELLRTMKTEGIKQFNPHYNKRLQ